MFFTNFNRTGYLLTQNDNVRYELTFTITNYLPSQGSIQIQFPSTFTLQTSYCRVFSSLYDISSTNKVTCTISSNIITIQSFAAVLANTQITIWLIAQNPSTSGTTANLVIETYYDSSSTQLVDSFTGNFNFTISSGYTTIQTWNINLANSAANSAGCNNYH